MPYNANVIPPRKEPTGQAQLPVTRVRKIISVDPDIAVCSNNAAFVITLATEMFVQYLASEGQNMVKLDRKPRRNVQYRDVASAVMRVDRLEFLDDVVPQTVPFGKVKNASAQAQAKLRDGTSAAKNGKGTAAAGGSKDESSSSTTAAGAATSTASTNGHRSSLSGSAPTAISALTNGDSHPPTSGSKKKKQQMLPFSILNGTDDANGGPSTFRSAREADATTSSSQSPAATTNGTSGGSSGVAAAAALAQAAMSDEVGPDDQLEQDMLRQRQNGDVEMTDA